jgi:hypothetical protein
LKSLNVPPVSAAISIDFLPPEWTYAALPSRKTPTVPEITINKDNDPITWKNQVGFAWQLLNMFTKAKSAPMDSASDHAFQRSVFVAHP